MLEMIAREGVPAAIEAKYRSEVSRKAGKRIYVSWNHKQRKSPGYGYRVVEEKEKRRIIHDLTFGGKEKQRTEGGKVQGVGGS